jgi:hypothetical protein
LTALAISAFVPSLAGANDAQVEQQLQQMQQRMQQMEDKLQATSDQLESANARVDEQSQLIEQSGLAETRGSSNGLPGILGELTIGGWVAASYFYNVNDPNDSDSGNPVAYTSPAVSNAFGVPNETAVFLRNTPGLEGTNQGFNGRYYPFHPDSNSFALDQVWFEIERPVSEEHRAGFRFDPAYGKTASVINGFGGPNNRDNRDDSSIYISQGYVQYLAPLGDGLHIKMGKFGTLLGTEVAQTVYNWNITRGSVYNLLEPIDHIGILGSYAFGDTGFDIALGGVNGFQPDDPDNNDEKSFLGHIGWANDMITAGVNVIHGEENTGFDGNQQGVLNALVKINASDRLGFWINGDWAYDDDMDTNAWGIAAAGRFGITERTGISLRGEYVADVGGALGFTGLSDPTDITGDGFNDEQLFFTGIETWGITATVDHLLTDNLMIRAEARYDDISKDDTDNDEFFKNSRDLKGNQITVGAEVIYNFNKFGGE